MGIIADKWEHYKKLVWPDLDPESHQFKVMKAVYYATWLDALTFLQEGVGSPEYSEEDGVKVLESLHKESVDWIKNHIEELMAETKRREAESDEH